MLEIQLHRMREAMQEINEAVQGLRELEGPSPVGTALNRSRANHSFDTPPLIPNTFVLHWRFSPHLLEWSRRCKEWATNAP